MEQTKEAGCEWYESDGTTHVEAIVVSDLEDEVARARDDLDKKKQSVIQGRYDLDVAQSEMVESRQHLEAKEKELAAARAELDRVRLIKAELDGKYLAEATIELHKHEYTSKPPPGQKLWMVDGELTASRTTALKLLTQKLRIDAERRASEDSGAVAEEGV